MPAVGASRQRGGGAGEGGREGGEEARQQEGEGGRGGHLHQYTHALLS